MTFDELAQQVNRGIEPNGEVHALAPSMYVVLQVRHGERTPLVGPGGTGNELREDVDLTAIPE
jgi:hypothetical protein